MQSRALLLTSAQSSDQVAEEQMDPDTLWNEQEEDAREEDAKTDNWEYRKRKNKFIQDETPKDNRGVSDVMLGSEGDVIRSLKTQSHKTTS